MKNYIYMFLIVILLTLIGIIIFIIKFNADNSIYLNLIIGGLILCLIELLSIALWMFSQRFKQLLEYEHHEKENGEKRTFEDKQAMLNQDYRNKALNQDKLLQVIKEISEKKEDTENPKEKKITFTINHSLIEDIKKVKDEIDKI